jgi:hypothetical protein
MLCITTHGDYKDNAVFRAFALCGLNSAGIASGILNNGANNANPAVSQNTATCHPAVAPAKSPLRAPTLLLGLITRKPAASADALR